MELFIFTSLLIAFTAILGILIYFVKLNQIKNNDIYEETDDDRFHKYSEEELYLDNKNKLNDTNDHCSLLYFDNKANEINMKNITDASYMNENIDVLWVSTSDCSSDINSVSMNIGYLVNLTEIDISYTQISCIPSEIGKLINLRNIMANNNKIEIIPPEIGKLLNLNYLNVSSNNIEIIPKEIGMLTNLTNLNLSNNNIGSICGDLRKLTKIENLNLENNNITSIPIFIGLFTKLINLKFDKNKVLNIDENILFGKGELLSKHLKMRYKNDELVKYKVYCLLYASKKYKLEFPKDIANYIIKFM